MNSQPVLEATKTREAVVRLLRRMDLERRLVERLKGFPGQAHETDPLSSCWPLVRTEESSRRK